MSSKYSLSTMLLHALHALLALCVPLAFLVMIGCMKAKPKKEDLGPEISAQTIQNILGAQMDAGNLNPLAIGQSVNYSETRRIENQDTDINLGYRHIDVLDRKDTPTEAIFTMRITRSVRQYDNSFLTTTTEDELPLQKSVPTSTSTSSVGPMAKTDAIVRQLLAHDPVRGLEDPPAPIETQQRTTFHHLRESNAVIDAPDSVKVRAGCGGLSPCQLNVHFVQFDMVLWNDSTSYQKYSMDFGFSTQTPYLPFGMDFDQFAGMLVIDCRSTFVPIPAGVSVYVRDCSTLDDFQR